MADDAGAVNEGHDRAQGEQARRDDGSAARGVTVRSVVTGLVLVLVLAVLIPWNDWALQNTQIYNNYLPPVVTVCVLILMLLVNPLLVRVGWRRYRRGELVVIAVMLLGLGGVVSGGLVRMLPVTMAGPSRHLASNPKFIPLRVALTEEELAAQRAAALLPVSLELANCDTDADGRCALAEWPDANQAMAMDAGGNGDGWLDADEVLDYRASFSESLLPEWRWPVPEGLTIGVPAAGPVPAFDPDYRYVVNGYLDGLPKKAEGEVNRVGHRMVVSWEDAAGQQHAEQLALSGIAAEQARLSGQAFLDLDREPGRSLVGRQAGETVPLADGTSVRIVAIAESGLPLHVWWAPLLAWSPLLVGAFIAMIALAGVVRRQWLHNERLPYPLAEVTLSLMEEPGPGRSLPPLFRNRGFWVAFICVAVIITWRGLHAYGLVPVDIKLSLNLWSSVLKGEPWTRMPNGYWLSQPTLWFSIIAMAFFMSLEVSFSLWFVFLFSNFLWAYLSMAGVPIDKGDYNQSTVGGFGAMVVVILWLGRHYYWRVCKAAIGCDRSPEAKEAAPYLWALLLGSATMVGWLLVNGASFSASLLLVLIFLGILLVLSRIVAESGMPFVQTGPAARVSPILFSTIGISTGATAMLPLALVGMALGSDNREALMPYATTASAMGDRAGLRPKRLSLIMLGAAVIGCAVAFVAMLAGGYHAGSASVDGWAFRAVGNFVLAPPTEVVEAAASPAGLERVEDLRGDRYAAWAGGAATVGVLGWLRMTVSWWPIHPIGFLMMASWCTMITYASFLVGWLWKGTVMRYGGVKVYQSLKPVAIGMIAGEASAVFVFMLVRLVAQGFGVELPEFKMLPV